MIIQWKWEIDLRTRSDRQSTWWTMDGGLWHCTGDRSKHHTQGENHGKKGKWFSEEALQNYEKKEIEKQRRKGKIYPFECKDPKIARRDKKAILRDQWKEIEANNRMEKTTDLFKKIGYTKGIFHAKMCTIKDRNVMEIREAEDIKKRWQK